MAKRKYESKLRKQQTRDTRQRILKAAARVALLDTSQLSHAVVAQAAEVSERTVWRYFPTVDELQSACLDFQVAQVGNSFPEGTTIEDFPAIYERTAARFEGEVLDAYLRLRGDSDAIAAVRRRRYVRTGELLREILPDATQEQIHALVLVFGLLFSPAAFAHGKTLFDLDVGDVASGPAWAMRVLTEALRQGDTPWKQS